MYLRFIGRIFGTGLLVVLPIALTVYLLVWLGSVIESGAWAALAAVPGAPQEWKQIPGLGIVLAVAVVFAVGLTMQAPGADSMVRWFEMLLGKIPLINSLYGSLRDLMSFFSGEKTKRMSRVVILDLTGDGSARLIGFVTRESFDDLPKGVGDEDMVTVYLPMSYQMGGYTVFVPRDRVTPIEMSMDQAMRFVLTAGVKQEESKRRKSVKSK